MQKTTASRSSGSAILTRNTSASVEPADRDKRRMSSRGQGVTLKFRQGTGTRSPQVSGLHDSPAAPGAGTPLVDVPSSTSRTARGQKRRRIEGRGPSYHAQRAGQPDLSSTLGTERPQLRRSPRISKRLELSNTSLTPPSLPTSNASVISSMRDVSSEADFEDFIAGMHIHVNTPGHPIRTEFRRALLDTQSDLNLIPEKQLSSLRLLGQMHRDTKMVPARIRTIGRGKGPIITPKGFVFLEWHMHGHSHTTYREKFYVLPSRLDPPFDCLIGKETIIRAKLFLRNRNVFHLARV